MCVKTSPAAFESKTSKTNKRWIFLYPSLLEFKDSTKSDYYEILIIGI